MKLFLTYLLLNLLYSPIYGIGVFALYMTKEAYWNESMYNYVTTSLWIIVMTLLPNFFTFFVIRNRSGKSMTNTMNFGLFSILVTLSMVMLLLG